MRDHTLLAEFTRRLRHQLALWESHERVHEECHPTSANPCRVGTLIGRGIGDSWTTLKGMGYGREAGEMIRAVMGNGEGGQ